MRSSTRIEAVQLPDSQADSRLRRLAEEQAALRRVARLVASGAASREVFSAVVREVARVMHLPMVVVCRYDGDGMMTVIAAWSDRPHLLQPGTRWPLDGESMAARVKWTGRPARIEDYTGLPGELAAGARASGLNATAGAPIVVNGCVWGVIGMSSPDAPLAEHVEDRLADFTELLVTAIATAEIREKLTRLAAELDLSRARILATADATRRRIERDLHDGAQQQLVAAALELRAVQAATPPELGKQRTEIGHIVERLVEVLDGLREIALGIHPSILAESGLGPALKMLVCRSPIEVELDVRVRARLPEPVEVAAYYVVSEALTNTAKHAGASAVHVVAEEREHVLRVGVRDDGCGGADPARGSGLLGLKDRAEAIGGTLSIESPQGAGTSLRVELPLDD
jgi:signal transduction histidine kinase